MLDAMGSWVVGALAQSAVVLGAGWAASLLLSRRPAAVRHHAWLLALAAALAAPAAALVAPKVDVLLSSVPPASEPPAADLLFGAPAAPDPARHFGGEASSRPGGRGAWRAAAAVVWSSGAILRLVLGGLRRVRLRRLIAASRESDSGEFRIHEAVRSPMLAGLRRPTVLLPCAALEWPPDERAAVVAHERAHLARRDHVAAAVSEAACLIYWPNPLVWVAARALERERESACDAEVLRAGIRPSVYASALLRAAQGAPGLAGVPAMAAERLQRRVRQILDQTAPQSGQVPIRWPATAAIIAAWALAAGAVHLTASAPPSQAAVRAGAQAAANPRDDVTAAAARPAAPAVAAIEAPRRTARRPAAGPQAAPAGGATFAGTLRDALGRALPDRDVALVNLGTAARYETRTDEGGRFAFGPLAGGEYEVQVQIPGFQQHAYRVALQDGVRVQRDVTLQVGSIRETIVVSPIDQNAAAPPLVADHPRYTPPADVCTQSSIGGCLTPPLHLRRVTPRYPAVGGGGTVTLEGRVGVDGFVKALRVRSPADPELAGAALDAVSQWQFTPAWLDGVPVEVGIEVSVRFADR